MSTKICENFTSYIIDSKRFSIKKRSLQVLYKSLTGRRVSKAGRPYLYGSRAYREVFKHVFRRLDASDAYDWCLYSLLRFPNQPHRDRFYRRARQPTRLVP